MVVFSYLLEAFLLLSLALVAGSWGAQWVGLEQPFLPLDFFCAKMVEMPVVLIGILLLLRRHNERFSDLGWRLSSQGIGPDLRFGAFLALPLLLLNFGVSAITALAFDSPPRPLVFRIEGFSDVVWMTATAWSAGAFLEEFLYRGFLFRRFEQVFAWARPGHPMIQVRATMVVAVIFGVLHAYQGPVAAFSAAVSAMVLQFVFLKSGRRLLPCIVCHGVYDTVQIALVSRL